jgi:hypothetical protein
MFGDISEERIASVLEVKEEVCYPEVGDSPFL